MSNKTHKETLREKIVSEFARYENSLNGKKNSLLHHHRREAVAFIESVGFPAKKHEEWRYANLAFLNKYDFRLQINSPELALNTELPKEIIAKIPNITDSIRLVFVNGYYSRSYSDVPETDGLTISLISDFINSDKSKSNEISSNKISSNEISSNEISSNEISSNEISSNEISSNE